MRSAARVSTGATSVGPPRRLRCSPPDGIYASDPLRNRGLNKTVDIEMIPGWTDC